MNAKRTEPSRHCYQGFEYVPAVKTDIRVTFERVRAEIARQQAQPRKPS